MKGHQIMPEQPSIFIIADLNAINEKKTHTIATKFTTASEALKLAEQAAQQILKDNYNNNYSLSIDADGLSYNITNQQKQVVETIFIHKLGMPF